MCMGELSSLAPRLFVSLIALPYSQLSFLCFLCCLSLCLQPPGLAALSQYKQCELVTVMQRLQELQRQAILSANPHVVFRQYMTAQHHSVASWFPHC